MSERKFGWNVGDAEQFCCADDTEEAHCEAQQYINDQYDLGEEVEYEVFEVIPAFEIALSGGKSREWLAEHIVEYVDERAAEETGAENETFDLSDKDMQELGDLVAKFILDRAKPAWFGVKPGTEEKFTHVSGTEPDHDPVPAPEATA